MTPDQLILGINRYKNNKEAIRRMKLLLDMPEIVKAGGCVMWYDGQPIWATLDEVTQIIEASEIK